MQKGTVLFFLKLGPSPFSFVANSLFLTSIVGREYPFLVKGGTDSNLNGRDRRVA